MTTPFDEYLARARRQPGVSPTRERGEPGAVTTPYERPAGRPWVGAYEEAADRDGGPAPVVQEAQRTAGVLIAPGRAYGFFTDTTLCIGCKACEVACKQWNQLPAEGMHFTGTSYDNTRDLSATTWRHVHFIEQFDEDRFESLPGAGGGSDEAGRSAAGTAEPGAGALPGAGPPERSGWAGPRRDGHETYPMGAQELRLNLPAEFEPWGNLTASEQWATPGARWLLMSDVCKHCVNAPCLEACPTGSIIRTEFDSVYVQQDICNGCGYCQAACPFGVVEVDKAGTGKAHKCTLCYDRLKDGLEPACSKACPTESIQFGAVDDLLERARVRVAELRARGIPAYLYGSGGILEDDADTSDIGGLNCFFLLIDRPEVYNLPPVAKRPSTNTGAGLLAGGVAAAFLTAATFLAFRAGASPARPTA